MIERATNDQNPSLKRARCVTASGRNRFQGVGKRRKAQHLTRLGRAAPNEEMPRGAGVPAQVLDERGPVERDARGDREPGLRVMDRGSERAVEAEAAVSLEDRAPRLDGSRNSDRMDRVKGDARDASQHFQAHACAGPSRSVVAPNRRPRLGDQAEAVAADTGHLRFDDAEHRNRGDRGIRRITSGAERLDRG